MVDWNIKFNRKSRDFVICEISLVVVSRSREHYRGWQTMDVGRVLMNLKKRTAEPQNLEYRISKDGFAALSLNFKKRQNTLLRHILFNIRYLSDSGGFCGSLLFRPLNSKGFHAGTQGGWRHFQQFCCAVVA